MSIFWLVTSQNRSVKVDFSFTEMPVVMDSNLTDKYKKGGKIEDYLEKLI